jgi:hypothetical protein
MADKYDEAVAHLTAHPDEIYEAWMSAQDHTYGCLFRFLPNEHNCLTMLRSEPWNGRSELSRRAAKDERLPTTRQFLGEKTARIEPTWTLEQRLASLPVFAEYQRLADQRR